MSIEKHRRISKAAFLYKVRCYSIPLMSKMIVSEDYPKRSTLDKVSALR